MTDPSRAVDAAEHRAAFEALFPGMLEDGVLDAARLAALLGARVAEAPAFGLHWTGKAAAGQEAGLSSDAVLVADADPEGCGGDPSDVFIEGDNLEVLRLLRPAYAGQVKVIYIDPPYNAGTAYVYNDRFAGGAVDDRHSAWLSMLYPRLLLARELLRPDGVLFVSIGDDEMRHLAVVLAEVFGEENLAATFVWQKKRKPSFLHRSVGSLTEYVLAVTRDVAHAAPFSIGVTTLGKKYPLNNAGNPRSVLTFPAGSVRFDLPDGVVEAQDMSDGAIVTHLLDDVEVRDGCNVAAFRLEGEWRYSQRRVEEIAAAGETLTIAKVPFRPNHVRPGGAVKKMHNLLTQQTADVGTNEDATAELEAVLGGALFENPKPTSLIRTLVKAVTYADPDALVLDFFAGSGTTGHAVALLNAADGGRRRVVSVNLPEPVPAGSTAARHGYATVADLTRARLAWVAEHVTGAAPLRTYRVLAPEAARACVDVRPGCLVAGERLHAGVQLDGGAGSAGGEGLPG